MRTAQFLDIGSTYTKLLTVDLDDPRVLAATATPTTPADLSVGVEKVLAESGVTHPPSLLAACSSAAGGLAVVVSGLVPRLSLEAARRAAFGAGARVVGSFSHRLDPDDVMAIDRDRPQVVLLTGGIDGGDREVVTHNAAMIGRLTARPAVVVACNREVSAAIGEALATEGFEVHVVANLLPEIDEVDLAPTRAAIREVFLARIAHGPGLEAVSSRLHSELVPTPRAVLDGVGFLAGMLGEPLVAVEVGGATTNVHSHAEPASPPGVVVRGLPAETLSRTVEGDLGVRHNADAVIQAAGSAWFDHHSGPAGGTDVAGWADAVLGTSRLPSTPSERALDEAMALFCLRTAIERHVGRRIYRRQPDGSEVVIQRGKDLSSCAVLVAVGGSLIWSSNEAAIGQALEGIEPHVLAPHKPEVVLDRDYSLYAIGLLSRLDPDAASALARASLRELWER